MYFQNSKIPSMRETWAKENYNERGVCVYTNACLCVCVCIWMYTYMKNLDGFINPTIVHVSYLVHKATVKQPIISMPDI